MLCWIWAQIHKPLNSHFKKTVESCYTNSRPFKSYLLHFPLSLFLISSRRRFLKLQFTKNYNVHCYSIVIQIAPHSPKHVFKHIIKQTGDSNLASWNTVGRRCHFFLFFFLSINESGGRGWYKLAFAVHFWCSVPVAWVIWVHVALCLWGLCFFFFSSLYSGQRSSTHHLEWRLTGMNIGRKQRDTHIVMHDWPAAINSN